MTEEDVVIPADIDIVCKARKITVTNKKNKKVLVKSFKHVSCDIFKTKEKNVDKVKL